MQSHVYFMFQQCEFEPLYGGVGFCYAFLDMFPYDDFFSKIQLSALNFLVILTHFKVTCMQIPQCAFNVITGTTTAICHFCSACFYLVCSFVCVCVCVCVMCAYSLYLFFIFFLFFLSASWL